MDIVDVMEEVLSAEGIDMGECCTLVYEDFMEKVNKDGQAEIQNLPLISDCTQPEEALNGQSRAAVEEMALCYAQAELEEAGLDGEVELLAARVYGSRTREGLYREDSDIDVAISYMGNIWEDSFFDMLGESGLKMAGLPVDMNPVSLEKTGTLEEYLADAERYLDHKEIQMRETGTAENTGSKDSVTVAIKETEEKRSVLENLKNRQARLAGRENPAERPAGYKREGVEL